MFNRFWRIRGLYYYNDTFDELLDMLIGLAQFPQLNAQINDMSYKTFSILVHRAASLYSFVLIGFLGYKIEEDSVTKD